MDRFLPLCTTLPREKKIFRLSGTIDVWCISCFRAESKWQYIKIEIIMLDELETKRIQCKKHPSLSCDIKEVQNTRFLKFIWTPLSSALTLFHPLFILSMLQYSWNSCSELKRVLRCICYHYSSQLINIHSGFRIRTWLILVIKIVVTEFLKTSV